MTGNEGMQPFEIKRNRTATTFSTLLLGSQSVIKKIQLLLSLIPTASAYCLGSLQDILRKFLRFHEPVDLDLAWAPESFIDIKLDFSFPMRKEN